MLKLVIDNAIPCMSKKPNENFPWTFIQLGTLNGLSAVDIVKLATQRNKNE